MAALGNIGVSLEDLRAGTPISIAFIVVAWLTFASRMYVRLWLVRDFGGDDACMAITMLLFTAYVVEIGLTIHGLAAVLEFGTLGDFQFSLMRVRDLGILYALTTVFAKFSFLFFLLRFHLPRWLRILTITMSVAYAVIAMAGMAVAVNQCYSATNVDVFMHHYLSGTCMSWRVTGPVFYVAGVADCITHWLLVGVPMHLVVRSTLSRQSKVAATAIIVLGSAGGICSLVRIAYVRGLDIRRSLFPPQGVRDVTTAELGFCIISSCVATLRPLYLAVRNRIHKATMSTTSRTGSLGVTGEKHEGRNAVRVPAGGGVAFRPAEGQRTVHAIRGVGVLSDMCRTNMSTVTSAIFRRIRNEDFVLYGADGTTVRRDTRGVGMYTTVDLDNEPWLTARAGRPGEADSAPKPKDALVPTLIATVIASPPASDVEAGPDPAAAPGEAAVRQEVAAQGRETVDTYRLSIRSFEIGKGGPP